MRSLAALAVLTLALARPAAAEEAKPQGDAAKPQEPAKAAPEQPAKAAPEQPAKKAEAPAKPQQDAKLSDSQTLYGVGLAIARSLEVFALSPTEVDQVVKGLRDGVAGKGKLPFDQKLQSSINDLARARAPKAQEKAAARDKVLAAKEKEAGAPYLAKMAKDPAAKKTASGAIVIPEKEGTGAAPKETDKVKVNYTGTLVNGSVFDSSQGRGPAEFPLDKVIKCWTEALQLVKVGGKAKVVCPSAIAYGERGNPPVIPGNAVLTFEVELLDILPATAPQSTPPGPTPSPTPNQTSK